MIRGLIRLGLPLALAAVTVSPVAGACPLGDAAGGRMPERVEIGWDAPGPFLADADLDGIPDMAEDVDGDGLSAAGEARYGTDPSRADTDLDGIDDWHDDADGDLQPDGPMQDARPVPDGLTPSLARAADDRPRSYRDGCHQNAGRRPRICRYGSTAAGAPTVVLFGDSHAAQWLPALEVIAWRSGMRIVSITRSSCPVADVTILDVRHPDLGAICDAWRRRAVTAVARLHPDTVVVASFTGYAVDGIRAGDERARRTAWFAGWRRSLHRLRPHADRVVLFGETPRYRTSAVACLARHADDLSRCSTPRRMAIDAGWNASEARIARRARVDHVETASLICPYDPCPVVIGDRLPVFDIGHLNASYARLLALALERRLEGGSEKRRAAALTRNERGRTLLLEQATGAETPSAS